MELAQEILAGLCVATAIAYVFYQVYSRVRGSGGCGKGCGGCKEKKGVPTDKVLLQVSILGKKDSTLRPL